MRLRCSSTLKVVLSVVLGLLLLPPSPAAIAARSEYLILQRRVAKMTSLAGMLAVVPELSGQGSSKSAITFIFKKPNLFRLKAQGVAMGFDGKEQWTYDSDHRRYLHGPVKRPQDGPERLPGLESFFGISGLRKPFRVEDAIVGGEKLRAFSFPPERHGKNMTTLTVFATGYGLIWGYRAVPDVQPRKETVFRYTLNVNPKLKDSEFGFGTATKG